MRGFGKKEKLYLGFWPRLILGPSTGEKRYSKLRIYMAWIVFKTQHVFNPLWNTNWVDKCAVTKCPHCVYFINNSFCLMQFYNNLLQGNVWVEGWLESHNWQQCCIDLFHVQAIFLESDFPKNNVALYVQDFFWKVTFQKKSSPYTRRIFFGKLLSKKSCRSIGYSIYILALKFIECLVFQNKNHL